MKTKKWYIVVPSGVLAGVLVLVFLSNVYVKRGLQARLRGGADTSPFRRGMIGRLKTPSDKIGKQFDPASDYQSGWRDQYERQVRISNDAEGLSTGTIAGKFIDKLSDTDDRGLRDEVSVYEPYDITGRGYDADGKLRLDTFGEVDKSRQLVALGGDAAEGKTGVQIYSYSPAKAPSPEGAPVIVVQPVLPATGIGDKIIRTAEVRLEVEDAGKAYTRVSAICQELGGYLAASNFHKDREGRQAGTITMRIPKDKFLDALNKINVLGKVENSSTQSQDVSQEYANLKNQLDTTMIVYDKMMQALQKRHVTIPEAMRLESELSPILRRVEYLKNRIDYLNNAISFTTVTVHFHEPEVSLKALKDSKQSIKESMLAATIGAIKFLAKAIPVTIAVIIWLAVVLGIVIVLKNWVTRLFKRQ